MVKRGLLRSRKYTVKQRNISRKLSLVILSFVFFFFSNSVNAEDLAPGRVIPKLAQTPNDPLLTNGKVYPFWGPVCQRYTYSVIYSDKEGRAPEYMKIYFNGKMLDMEKENPDESDYKKGIKYIFRNVPNKIGSNFYYFEASNGAGKARASIIESPDNGPVLFDTDFKDNEIVVIDLATNKEVWRYPLGEEWVGGVALSDDGKYLAAQISNHVYLFDTGNKEPLWIYESATKGAIGGDVKGGIAISGDGEEIFAAINGKALFFNKKSNKPLWNYNLEQNGGGAYGVDISQNGSHAAVAMAGSESDENSNVLILFDQKGKKLWQYHSTGNWHEVSFSDDGSYIAGATGCPDRRGYLFSKDSDKPIIKSEPLSKESPIDEAQISASGNLVAYGVESGYGAVVLMDKESGKILWKYETPQGKSVRALAMTPNGGLIGAGTFGGDILLFEKESNIPIERLKINSSIGAFDLSGDGEVFVTGSADKKVRVFHKGERQAQAEISLNEYVGEVDVSGNGKFAAAGTSGSVYFFETLIDLNNIKAVTCSQIIEPPEEDTSLFRGQNSGGMPGNDMQRLYGPTLVPASLLALSLIVLAGYVLIYRKRKVKPKKIIIVGASVVILISLAATMFYIWREKTDNGQEANRVETSGEAGVCGNEICEPDFGETQTSCVKDCTPSEGMGRKSVIE